MIFAQAAQEPRQNTPLLSKQNLMLLAGGVFVVTLVGLVMATLLVRKDPSLLPEIVSLKTLYVLTVGAVLMITGTLAVEGILSGEAVAGILGGIIGYVLGSLKHSTQQE